MKKAFFLLFLIWLCLPLLNLRGPDQFSSSRLVAGYQASSSIEEDHATTRRILSSLQKEGELHFEYLGHGTQMVAFASSDGQYVLKCFLSRVIDAPKKGGVRPLLRLFPSYLEKEEKRVLASRARKLEQVLGAYALSFRELKEETGLISLHLHPTQNLFPKCTVRDRYGKAHEIDLDRTAFILQKRAELMSDRFARMTTEEECEQAVGAMHQLFETLIRKGVSDFNNRFKVANYGFIGDRPVMIDTGRTSYSPEAWQNPEPEIQRMKQFLASWLEKEAKG